MALPDFTERGAATCTDKYNDSLWLAEDILTMASLSEDLGRYQHPILLVSSNNIHFVSSFGHTSEGDGSRLVVRTYADDCSWHFGGRGQCLTLTSN